MFSYTLNQTAPTVEFDGIGAISGGGGEGVLLPHYPSPQREEVLDYLFAPNFGASLHTLKIEVGGDSLSTDGSEPSHMHTENDPPSFDRGMEWWMATQARERNPDIQLYALPWEWPAWVGAGDTSSPYANLSKPLFYMTEWLRGGRDHHNLSFDYVGVWNENECDADYLVALREALDANDFADTLIIAPDTTAEAANELLETMLERPDVAAAVHAVGYHYPDSDTGAAAQAAALGVRIWASEDDSTVSPPAGAAPPTSEDPRIHPGGGCLVRTINENWVRGNMSSTIVWNLVMARYPQMRWDYTGLMAATDPFGGSYEVLPAIWAAAHTAQFTRPGWGILEVGEGSGWLERGGTYVSYAGEGELTIVVEKMDAASSLCERGGRPDDRVGAPEAENATFVVGGHVGEGEAAEVWASHFGFSEFEAGGGDGELFVRLPDRTVAGGAVTVEVLPNWAYTISTRGGASKGGGGGGEVPPRGAFPEKYSDDYDDCRPSGTPKFLAPMAGAFECVELEGGGRAVRQAAPELAICDRGDVRPYAVIGDGFRVSYNVSVDVLLGEGGGGFVGARVKGAVGSGTGMDGVFFAVNAAGWEIALQLGSIGTGAVASGELELGGGWTRLELAVEGEAATASVNGAVVATDVKIPAPYEHLTAEVSGVVVGLGEGGYAAIGTVGYDGVLFDNLRVESK